MKHITENPCMSSIPKLNVFFCAGLLQTHGESDVVWISGKRASSRRTGSDVKQKLDGRCSVLGVLAVRDNAFAKSSCEAVGRIEWGALFITYLNMFTLKHKLSQAIHLAYNFRKNSNISVRFGKNLSPNTTTFSRLAIALHAVKKASDFTLKKR